MVDASSQSRTAVWKGVIALWWSCSQLCVPRSLSTELGRFGNLILYLGRLPLTGNHPFTLAVCMAAHSAWIDLSIVRKKPFLFCQLIFFFFFKHKSFFVSEPLELNRKTKTTAVINATWQHFFSFLSQMRTLQPISGIPRIGEWLAHKKDKSYGELNLAPILWNVSTYLSGRRQACLSVKASQQDGAWYLFCPTLWCTKGVDGVTLRGSIFQGVCWTS